MAKQAQVQPPDCPINQLREFLKNKGWHKDSSFSDGDEYWFDSNDINYTYFPTDKDLVPFSVIVMVINQLGAAIIDIPFYREYFPYNYPGY